MWAHKTHSGGFPGIHLAALLEAPLSLLFSERKQHRFQMGSIKTHRNPGYKLLVSIGKLAAYGSIVGNTPQNPNMAIGSG